ncbi:MAG: T9SS type A sorting domain-containing protein [Flavobacteriales bacterium]|nr:MAG: T9SS type A sorting domain-containing protein [Flavobacteriales bacterium]
MKKVILFTIAFLLFTQVSKAIKVRFTVANMSVNVAEGSIGVFTFFEIYPDDFVQTDSTDFIELIDFPEINYNDIHEIMIEKTILTSDYTPIFNRLTSFILTDSIGFGDYTDEDFIQGSTYAYRLSAITHLGQQLNLINKSMSTGIANPIMNCAKLNNIYRKAGHNTYQNSVFPSFAGGLFNSLFYTRVLELDVWNNNNNGVWDVRHIGSGNKNNCGFGTTGNNTFIFCLNDVNNWHTQHPNHDPIIVHIDLKQNFNFTHTPLMLDNWLNVIFGSQNIYKPRDLIGNNFANMRAAAQQNNWPSMGDLTGKIIIVLTGDGGKVSKYIADRSLNAIAFSAAKVENNTDVNDLTRAGIWSGLENDIVFYNMQQFGSPFVGGDADFNTGFFTSSLNYINRTYGGGFFGQPGDYSNSEYDHAIDFNMNNIAVANITSAFYPLENGIQWLPDVTYPALVNDHIYSNYQNVTQAAIYNIVATDLIVEPEAHYRMIAGNSIDLQNNVDIKEGSDVDIRIDNCTNTGSYNLRQSAGEQLTQEEINVLMHELDKELYGYTPADEKEIVRLYVYPNPTSNIVNISYTNYLLNNAIFTLYDLTGRLVKTENYTPQTEGNQHFSLSINELKTGTYFYTLQVGEQTYNGKVVKINQ